MNIKQIWEALKALVVLCSGDKQLYEKRVPLVISEKYHNKDIQLKRRKKVFVIWRTSGDKVSRSDPSAPQIWLKLYFTTFVEIRKGCESEIRKLRHVTAFLLNSRYTSSQQAYLKTQRLRGGGTAQRHSDTTIQQHSDTRTQHHIL
ncbi:unnamed protein product [Ceratitis capitata]|uniref:(Mediterranean fruit fly) hypothetical protein n=1 Tax=Ceratitis capitata TaxID=7213 RepID=A0A811U1Y8_CERCA|nr:unnamed protein product [Ceratitis capitata]